MQKLEFTQLQFLTQNTPSMFCFDFDGTLADIVDNYEEVIFEPKTHINIKELSQKYFVSILTGRSLENIKNIINIPGLTYVGNHGLEIQFNASLSWQHPNIPLQQIKTIKQQLNSCFYNIPGVFIEDKGLTLALHFRKVNEKNLNSIHTKATSILKKHPKIHFFMGKKVINITPKVKWNKGKSLAKALLNSFSELAPHTISQIEK